MELSKIVVCVSGGRCWYYCSGKDNHKCVDQGCVKVTVSLRLGSMKPRAVKSLFKKDDKMSVNPTDEISLCKVFFFFFLCCGQNKDSFL